MAQAALLRARRSGDPARELATRRRVRPLLAVEHLALALALLAGLALLQERGWGAGRARWLGLKLGLTLFLVVPLEAMHAWVCHGWIARGLKETPALINLPVGHACLVAGATTGTGAAVIDAWVSLASGRSASSLLSASASLSASSNELGGAKVAPLTGDPEGCPSGSLTGMLTRPSPADYW